MQNKVDKNNTGSFNVETLEKVVVERGRDKETLNDLIDALKVFDSDHDGKITAADFKHAMMTMGERMGEKGLDVDIHAHTAADQANFFFDMLRGVELVQEEDAAGGQ